MSFHEEDLVSTMYITRYIAQALGLTWEEPLHTCNSTINQ